MVKGAGKVHISGYFETMSESDDEDFSSEGEEDESEDGEGEEESVEEDNFKALTKPVKK